MKMPKTVLFRRCCACTSIKAGIGNLSGTGPPLVYRHAAASTQHAKQRMQSSHCDQRNLLTLPLWPPVYRWHPTYTPGTSNTMKSCITQGSRPRNAAWSLPGCKEPIIVPHPGSRAAAATKACDSHRSAQKYDSHAKGLKCNGGPHGRHQDGHSEPHEDDHQEEDRQEEATDLALREACEA